MSEELKPCPFCGGKADSVKRAHSWIVGCTQCTASVDDCTKGKKVAIEYWNKRSLAPVQEGKPQPKHLVRRGLKPDGTYPLADDDETAPASQGWVAVPKEPTREMLIAAGTIRNYDSESETADKDHIDWWKTMLAAAPHKEGE